VNLPWPKPWSGSNPMSVWINRLLACCRQQELLESKDIRRRNTPNGYYLELKVNASKGGAAASPANYKLAAITGFGSSLTPPLSDLLICSSASTSGAIGNDTIYVAKQRNMRQVAKEFFPDGGANVTQTYTYFGPQSNDSTYGENFRSATDGIQTELEAATPRYITKDILLANAIPTGQCFIYIIETGIPTGVKDPSGNDVTKLEIMPDRNWAKVVNA